MTNAAPHMSALRNPHTGLYHAEAFHELLEQLTRQATRYQSPLALMCVAFREPTALREQLGIDRAEQFVMHCAREVARAIRDVDIGTHDATGRFLVALPKTSAVAARTLAERVLRALQQICDQHQVPLAAPVLLIGLAELQPSRRTINQLCTAASDALQIALHATPPIGLWSDTPAVAAEEWRDSTVQLQRFRTDIAGIHETLRSSYVDRLQTLLAENAGYAAACTDHAVRVTALAEQLAAALGWQPSAQRVIARGALLHDIGLSILSERLLTKQSALDPAEQELVRQHPIIGVQLLDGSGLMREELATILHHHERFDGTGYPDRLAGSHIPIGARIVHLVESWDRMTTATPYREPLSHDDALAELTHQAGAQFDPDLTHTFVQMMTECTQVVR